MVAATDSRYIGGAVQNFLGFHHGRDPFIDRLWISNIYDVGIDFTVQFRTYL